MRKLIAHIVVALAIWGGLAAANVSVWVRLVAIVFGAMAVHWVFERFFADPFLYLGSMPVASDDPLMARARQQVKETWPQFLKLYPEHKEDSCVRFEFTSDTDQVEHLWGDALEISSDHVTVFVRTPPATQKEPLESQRMTIPIEKVTDWQIEFRDGTLRGGFSIRAMFKIFERSEGYLPREFKEQLDRFRDEPEIE
jgi:uncharacterized protein YegJ (DUF2314 family)